MTELFYRCKLTNNPWQECQFWSINFEEELGGVDVAEIQQLIVDGDNMLG